MRFKFWFGIVLVLLMAGCADPNLNPNSTPVEKTDAVSLEGHWRLSSTTDLLGKVKEATRPFILSVSLGEVSLYPDESQNGSLKLTQKGNQIFIGNGKSVSPSEIVSLVADTLVIKGNEGTAKYVRISQEEYEKKTGKASLFGDWKFTSSTDSMGKKLTPPDVLITLKNTGEVITLPDEMNGHFKRSGNRVVIRIGHRDVVALGIITLTRNTLVVRDDGAVLSKLERASPADVELYKRRAEEKKKLKAKAK